MLIFAPRLFLRAMHGSRVGEKGASSTPDRLAKSGVASGKPSERSFLGEPVGGSQNRRRKAWEREGSALSTSDQTNAARRHGLTSERQRSESQQQLFLSERATTGHDSRIVEARRYPNAHGSPRSARLARPGHFPAEPRGNDTARNHLFSSKTLTKTP